MRSAGVPPQARSGPLRLWSLPDWIATRACIASGHRVTQRRRATHRTGEGASRSRSPGQTAVGHEGPMGDQKIPLNLWSMPMGMQRRRGRPTHVGPPAPGSARGRSHRPIWTEHGLGACEAGIGSTLPEGIGREGHPLDRPLHCLHGLPCPLPRGHDHVGRTIERGGPHRADPPDPGPATGLRPGPRPGQPGDVGTRPEPALLLSPGRLAPRTSGWHQVRPPAGTRSAAVAAPPD
jgi:hypothetical protein